MMALWRIFGKACERYDNRVCMQYSWFAVIEPTTDLEILYTLAMNEGIVGGNPD
jgi:hypothetical protein